MNFAVIEGLDGSGKSTQIRLLRQELERRGIPHKYLHFPRTDAPVYGELVARFLRGELGEINSVHPYLVALIYAGDRMDAAPLIRQWMDEGYFVLADRYVISNIAFQCAKLKEGSERKKLKDWILRLEFNHNNLPVPGVNIFMDVPFSFTSSQLKGDRSGTDRDYLKGERDIHEEDLIFQSAVRDVYLSLQNEIPAYQVLNCTGAGGRMLSPDEVFEKLKRMLFGN